MFGVCNTEALAKIMEQKRISIQEMCNALNINKSTYYRKLQEHGRGFTVEEIQKISNTLELSADQKLSIFFTETVA